MDFRKMLNELEQLGQPVKVALPVIGVVDVTIRCITDDVIMLERAAPAQKFFLDYTSVVVVT